MTKKNKKNKYFQMVAMFTLLSTSAAADANAATRTVDCNGISTRLCELALRNICRAMPLGTILLVDYTFPLPDRLYKCTRATPASATLAVPLQDAVVPNAGNTAGPAVEPETNPGSGGGGGGGGGNNGSNNQPPGLNPALEAIQSGGSNCLSPNSLLVPNPINGEMGCWGFPQ